ncbi:12343_t:CDS:2 [Gigaspora rosea]|nr:12343_t:CDS:2 [Gigaspora rosea]
MFGLDPVLNLGPKTGWTGPKDRFGPQSLQDLVMPRPNAKSSIASNKARNSDGTFAKVINNIEEDTSEN